MRDICFIDKTYDSTLSNLYHLSIQISLDGFSFCILDIPKGKYIVLKGFHLFLKRPRLLLKHLKEFFQSEAMLNQTYKSVEVLYATNQFTIVPQPFYHKSSSERMLFFGQNIEKGFVGERNQLSQSEAWIIYAIPETLREFILSKYPKVQIKHNLYPLIEKNLKDNRMSGDGVQLHLNFLRGIFEVVLIKGSKLILCNIFEYGNEHDALYHVLNIFEQLKLVPDAADLIIHGEISQVSPLYHLFRKYIKRTSFARPNNLYSYSYTFSQLPEHYNTTLFNVYKCE